MLLPDETLSTSCLQVCSRASRPEGQALTAGLIPHGSKAPATSLYAHALAPLVFGTLLHAHGIMTLCGVSLQDLYASASWPSAGCYAAAWEPIMAMHVVFTFQRTSQTCRQHLPNSTLVHISHHGSQKRVLSKSSA